MRIDNGHKANRLTIEQAKEDYKELLEKAIHEGKWLKAKALYLYLSPNELVTAWSMGKFLFPVNYWTLCRPEDYLRPHEALYRKALNKLQYAKKRHLAYTENKENNNKKVLQIINN